MALFDCFDCFDCFDLLNWNCKNYLCLRLMFTKKPEKIIIIALDYG
jgi:hypothetical protein